MNFAIRIRNPRKRKLLFKLSPFKRVMAALVLGVFTGLFFGEIAGILDIIGKAYVRLLQMTVLPYILVATIGGLGKLDIQIAKQIGIRSGSLILFLWFSTMLTVLCLPLAYPNWTTASFFSSSMIKEGPSVDFLTLYLPSNPFFSLANTVVPAVVVFSILFGTALITLPNKENVIDILHTLSDALMKIASFVAKLAPFGIFAIAASAAGTLYPGELERLQIHLWVYLVAWSILAFLTLPLLVSLATPFSYRDVLRGARVAMVTAFAVGTVLVVLPMIAERCKALLAERKMESDESEVTVDVLVPTAYSFPSAGTLLGLAFILFAAWFVGTPLDFSQYPGFTVLGALTAFGSMAVAIPFLLNYFNFPVDLFQLYLLGSVVTARFATALAVLHGVAICLLGATAILGKLKWRSLFQGLAISLVVTGIVMAGLGAVLTNIIPFKYTGKETFESIGLYGKPVPIKENIEPPALSDAEQARSRLSAIKERGTLRVGYLSDRLPFVYRNNKGDLVGFDIDIMHSLGRDLGVDLEVVLSSWEKAGSMLKEGRIDILIGSIFVTPGRAIDFTFTHSYIDQTLAFMVKDHRAEEFSDLSNLLQMESLRMGLPKNNYYEKFIKEIFPNVEILNISSMRAFFKGDYDEVDAAPFSAEIGAAWTLLYPQYSIVVPKGVNVKAPTGFGLPHGQVEFSSFMNTWLDLKKKSGDMDKLFRHWILGEGQTQHEPRWSLIRNVLDWID
jgi:Na+/H+-dicarboxylate symporter/ABC-type amino acid transport substrate-binding protein